MEALFESTDNNEYITHIDYCKSTNRYIASLNCYNSLYLSDMGK